MKEAKVHRDAINELGKSLDAEMSSKVVQLDEETVELKGVQKNNFRNGENF